MKNSKPATIRATQQTAPRQSPTPVAVLPEEIPSWMVPVQDAVPVQATDQHWWVGVQQEETPWWIIQAGQGKPVGQKTR